MTGTGNDIVALKAIDIARTKQPKFYSKIIAEAEKSLFEQYLSTKISLENFVWLAWSVKESAYKFLQRFNPELVFSPTQTVIESLKLPAQEFEGTETNYFGFDEQTAYKGIVRINGHKLYSRSIITPEFIFSAVSDADSFENTYWGVKQITSVDAEEQSREVRLFLLNKLSEIYPGNKLEIAKHSTGFPVLMMDSFETDVPVSLAHHHHFVSYSFQIKA